jgi:uncharacterized membrane protein (UPF0127 family)
MPTRLQVLIPIGIATVIVGVAGIVSLPSDVSLGTNVDFRMGVIELDDKTLEVYIADTKPRYERGLMWESQEFLIDLGMLFIFNEPGLRSMWMQNMQFHLDIIWFNENGQVVSIEKNVPPCITPVEVMACQSVGVSADNAKYALEVKSGFVDKFGIGNDSKLEIISGN